MRGGWEGVLEGRRSVSKEGERRGEKGMGGGEKG